MNKCEISVIVPMHNESANIPSTLVSIATELQQTARSYEVIAVNDGSTDDTDCKLRNLSKVTRWLRVVSYHPNQGRGYAIREGIKAAMGRIICTIDADLSYTPDHLTRMISAFDRYRQLDCVIGSPYIKGGNTENVPRWRLWISRLGNKIISRAMGGRIKTATGVLRAYRAECIKSIELFSNGKELHLEILSKLIAAGYNMIEMPATLRGRKRGKSKFNFRAIASSHLLFSLHEKPMLLFGLIGALLIGGGFLAGGYIIYLWQMATLNPNRPLINLVALLILTGIQIVMFGFLGSGIVRLRREILVVQRENKSLEMKIEEWKESIIAADQELQVAESTAGKRGANGQGEMQNQAAVAGDQSSAAVNH